MDNSRNEIECTRDATCFQFDMAWALLEYHFNGLEDAECLWKPCERSLHVQSEKGLWVADWPTDECYDIGPASIAWTTWHIIYWWSMTFDYSFGAGQLSRETVYWPGSAKAAKQKITELHDKWQTVLKTLSANDFLSTQKTKWPFEEKPFYQLAAWLNLELIKNASEIGAGRFLYSARNSGFIKCSLIDGNLAGRVKLSGNRALDFKRNAAKRALKLSGDFAQPKGEFNKGMGWI